MTSGPELPPPGWHGDPDPAAPPGRLRYWDGHGWTDHASSPQAPPPPFGAVAVPARIPPRPGDVVTRLAGLTGTVIVIGVIVVAAVAFGVSATDARTESSATTTTTLAPASSATRRDFRPLMVPPPAGYRIVHDAPLDARSIAASAGGDRDAMAHQLTRDGFVTGWRRAFASTTTDARITVTVLQMASTAGVDDFMPASVRPYLSRRGWSFDVVADGFGAIGMSTRLPLDHGEYGGVFVLPVARTVLQIQTRASAPYGPQDLVTDLVNLQRPLVDD